jgi:hypothetical protein
VVRNQWRQAAHREAAYVWKSTGQEVTIGEMADLAIQHGLIGEHERAAWVGEQKQRLREKIMPVLHSMWGFPGAELEIRSYEPTVVPPYRVWQDDAYEWATGGEPYPGYARAAGLEQP